MCSCQGGQPLLILSRKGGIEILKRLLLIAALAAAGYLGYTQLSPPRSSHGVSDRAARPLETDRALARAFEERKSDLQAEGRGTVAKILSDDVSGDRHQRFILRLGSGQTLLVAHNIDRAPRVDGLRQGDDVSFRGEYEWNPSGGVIHWTHRDRAGRHPEGWLKHAGRIYQ